MRGLGPSLGASGLSQVLANPTLELRDVNGALVDRNDNWLEGAQAAIILEAGLAQANPLESAIAAALPPGSYTALLAGLNNGTGLGLVEVYASTGRAIRFVLSAYQYQTLDIPFPFTVTAEDQFNNTATDYAGTIHFTSTDHVTELPPESTLGNGTGTFITTLHTGASQSITATDTNNASVTGTASVLVSPPEPRTPTPSPTAPP